MRVEWQDGWAGQGGTGRGVPLRRPRLGPTSGAAHWTSATRSRRLYPSAQGQRASVLGPALARHFRLLLDRERSRLRPFHEPGAGSNSRRHPRQTPPPPSPHAQSPRPVPAPKAASHL